MIQELAEILVAYPVIPAWLIGFFGSGAYFSAIFFGFVSNEGVIEKICLTCPAQDANQPGNSKKTDKRLRWRRLFWFLFMGGTVAAVFQLAEKGSFVPVQAFVLGTTWPSIIAQLLGTQAIEKIKSQEADIAVKTDRLTAANELIKDVRQ